jgi:hypothetical protein
MDQLTGPSKKNDEEAIGKGSRALLWWGGKPFPKYMHSVMPSGCRLSTNDDLKTLSVVLRTYSEEKDPNALLYVRKKAGVPKNQSVGYLKVIQGHHYYLNITFAAGSTIAQLVGLHSWRPMVYLSVKKPEKTNTESIIGSRLFTNFVTNWAQGVELNPEERELKQAQDALVADQNDEENAKLPSSVSKSKERAVATTAAVNAATGLGAVPPVVSFLLNDSGMSGVGAVVPTSSQQRNPMYYNPATVTTTAFPPSLSGAVALQQQQTAQILAAHYQQQQQM